MNETAPRPLAGQEEQLEVRCQPAEGRVAGAKTRVTAKCLTSHAPAVKWPTNHNQQLLQISGWDGRVAQKEGPKLASAKAHSTIRRVNVCVC